MIRLRRLLALLFTTIVLAASVPPAPARTAQLRLCADLAAGQLTIEILGDSVAAGYGVTESKRWANQLQRQLPPGSAVWQGAVSGSLVEHYQVGGPYHYHVQFTTMAKPSLVITQWRINDQWMSVDHADAGYNPVTFKARYREILNEIRAGSPTTTIMIVVSPWVLDTRIDAGRYTQWDYIGALWELRVEYGAVAIWMDWMRFMPRPGQADTAGLLLYDLGHPSEAGQSVLAAHTYERITNACNT